MIAGRGRNKRTAALTAAFLAAAAPAPARAHLVTSGLGPVYDGISHLLLSPDDLLAALAMSMVGGLNGTPAARRTLFVLSAAWLMGGMAGLVVRSPLPAISTTMSLLALGGLAATDLRLPAVA
ncbi:MAG: HupE/UreJ family protein, partial [Rhodospirillales bacterium]|nr:HupE/UreJ family protein [Rhodospirillales bacterium]